VPVARSATLLAHPEVRAAVERLAGQLTVGDIRDMNQAVDARREDPAAVAGAFLMRLERERRSKG